MGYSTVGFILIGPKQLSDAAAARAVQHMRDIEHAFDQFIAESNAHADDVAGATARLERPRFAKVKEILERIQCIAGLDELEEQSDFVSDFFLTLAPEAFIDELTCVWYYQTRATMMRALPGSETHQIWVNTVRTWGGDDAFDYNENHAGYLAYRADIFNVLPVLGIE